jgi:hypothetical protein
VKVFGLKPHQGACHGQPHGGGYIAQDPCSSRGLPSLLPSVTLKACVTFLLGLMGALVAAAAVHFLAPCLLLR